MADTDFDSAVPIRDGGNSITVDGFPATQAVSIASAQVASGAFASGSIATGAIVDLKMDTDDDSIAVAQTVPLNIGLGYAWDPTGTWERIRSDGAGAVKVAVVSTTSATSNPVNSHLQSLALAAGAANRVLLEYNPSVATFYFNELWAAASGKMKVDVYTYTSASILATVEASGTKILVGYNSTANPNIDKSFQNDLIVAAGDSVYLVMSNLDNQAQDVHATVGGWS